MDLIQQLLSQQTGPLVEKLTGQLGFSPEQARSFVPAAVTQVIAAVKGGGLDLGSLLGGGDAGEVVDRVDTQALAQASGVDPAQAAAGLRTVAPSILEKLREQAGGAEGVLALLGGEKAGGLLGKAGGFASGLFKK